MSRPISFIARFLRTAAAGGIVLLVATAAALLWANSPWSDSYADLLATRGSLPGTDLGPADLHHWVNDGLMAIFFFVAGLSGDAIGDAATSTIAVGAAVGLVVGKPLGILVAAWLAVRLRWAVLPDGIGWRPVAGMAAVAGIGFTVSLFVAGLAFDDAAPVEQATIGVLAGSVIAATLGAVLLTRPDTDVR